MKAGLKKGGAAKGELVLAIFELANCFRHGWGIPKDAVAAKQVGASIFSLHPLPPSVLILYQGLHYVCCTFSNSYG